MSDIDTCVGRRFPKGPFINYNVFLDLIKVCIIRLDHICFEKSSSTFWQVRCCAHRTRRSCQTYDEDFFKFCGLLRKPKLYKSLGNETLFFCCCVGEIVYWIFGLHLRYLYCFETQVGLVKFREVKFVQELV